LNIILPFVYVRREIFSHQAFQPKFCTHFSFPRARYMHS
jgi:hypothetical protein